MRLCTALFVVLTGPAGADSMVATRMITAQTVLAAEDIAMVAAEIPGALTDPAAALGQEARVTLYAGRPIHAADLGSAALIERNQAVTLIFSAGGLSIRTGGRALDRGGPGDVIKVMNLASHLTVSGIVGADGSVSVGPDSKG